MERTPCRRLTVSPLTFTGNQYCLPVFCSSTVWVAVGTNVWRAEEDTVLFNSVAL